MILQNDQADLAAYKMCALLDGEVEYYMQRAEALCDGYTRNSEIIYELMEMLNEMNPWKPSMGHQILVGELRDSAHSGRFTEMEGFLGPVLL